MITPFPAWAAGFLPVDARARHWVKCYGLNAARRAAACTNTARKGSWLAGGTRTRRVLRTTAAPILSSFSRIVAVHARSSSLPRRASRLRFTIKVWASAHDQSHLGPLLAQPRCRQLDQRAEHRAGVAAGRAQHARQQVLPRKHVQRQVAAIVVVALEVRLLLRPVQRHMCRIHVQHQFPGGAGAAGNEAVQPAPPSTITRALTPPGSP